MFSPSPKRMARHNMKWTPRIPSRPLLASTRSSRTAVIRPAGMSSRGSTSRFLCEPAQRQSFPSSEWQVGIYSLFFGKLWRNFRIPRRSLLQIHIHSSAGISDTPANSTGERIQEKLILPILRPVAHRGKEHTAFPVHPRPHHRIRRAPVALSLHAMCVQREDHVEIGHKSFNEYHSSLKLTGDVTP